MSGRVQAHFSTRVQTWPFKGAAGDRGLLECAVCSCPEGMAVAAAFWMECGEGAGWGA